MMVPAHPNSSCAAMCQQSLLCTITDLDQLAYKGTGPKKTCQFEDLSKLDKHMQRRRNLLV